MQAIYVHVDCASEKAVLSKVLLVVSHVLCSRHLVIVVLRDCVVCICLEFLEH